MTTTPTFRVAVLCLLLLSCNRHTIYVGQGGKIVGHSKRYKVDTSTAPVIRVLPSGDTMYLTADTLYTIPKKNL